ncbi:hypothetical protein BT63DRAFT_424475 [Microthyrium microscopicum]|uniref:Uncharacterized protein n=1 Tax=Microthyrium microscopicum TaxID=703497 RepID=A0A6A6UI51_9PEZI|nr:hypothetical protein BT63DRAFT_424475 [Microthyrium microscopicum]
MDRSIHDQFVIVAVLNEPTRRRDLVLNLLEMWCALLFKTIQFRDLEEWLDADLYDVNLDEAIIPLNVALPIDHGDSEASLKAFDSLRDSDEPLAKNYYKDLKRGRLRPRASTRRRSRQTTPVVEKMTASPTEEKRDAGNRPEAESGSAAQSSNNDSALEAAGGEAAGRADGGNDVATGVVIGVFSVVATVWIRRLLWSTYAGGREG